MATECFDEFIAMNVLLEAINQDLVIKNNFPLFLVPKGGNLESINALPMANVC